MRFLPLSSVAATAGVVLMSLVTGCERAPAPSGQSADTSHSAAETVKVVHPRKMDVRRLIERPGYNIEAYQRTALYAKLAGYVRKWNADMGDRVSKDQVLAEISIPEMDVEFRQKTAAVNQAASEIDLAEAAKLRSVAELRRAQSQYERLARAGRQGVLDKEQVDETRLGFEAAQAALAKAEADIKVAQARLEVAKADRDHLDTLLKYTKIRAPFNGVVTGRRKINIGDFVQPAATGKEESLFIVEQIKPVRVFVNVKELDAAWVHKGDVALIEVQSLRHERFKGAVTRASDSLHPQNRTRLIQVDLRNDDGKLLPGMFVNATILVEHKNVWALPGKAVTMQGGQSVCYRLENGKAVRMPIQVGLRGNEDDKEWVEVLKKQTKPAKAATDAGWEDLNGNEVIIASAVSSLVDGQRVNVSSDKK